MSAAREGLNYERMRMDAASRNIAAANVPVPVGQTATQWKVDLQAGDFGQLVGSGTAAHETPTGSRSVHDPAHPMADSDGMVRYPDTDLVHEMTTLMTASRGYEANVRSFNLLRNMTLRALEIGAK
ncbi:flagellar basal body rod protein FlgC [Novilysobacter erysipheiresistens]|uniref:Flagellar basal body rod C-terminal domain-containing protein n=1 Tax=Novilysobacter erysipheiresistens TaxID=1749332 RepID=A0ABU7Z091_9GAMM